LQKIIRTEGDDNLKSFQSPHLRLKSTLVEISIKHEYQTFSDEFLYINSKCGYTAIANSDIVEM